LQPKPTKHPDDTRFRVLRVLTRNPELTQREIAAQLGMSTSGLNYVLHALIDKGLVKVRNFAQSSNKLGYVYLLTPQGIAEKTQLTQGFITRKLAERAALEAEIHEILAEGDEVSGVETSGDAVLLVKN
jgi:EPS-associated MarR family transcriptional regulator